MVHMLGGVASNGLPYLANIGVGLVIIGVGLVIIALGAFLLRAAVDSL